MFGRHSIGGVASKIWLQWNALIETLLRADNPIMAWPGVLPPRILLLVLAPLVLVNSLLVSPLHVLFLWETVGESATSWRAKRESCHLGQPRLPHIICPNLFCPESSFTLKCVKGSTAAGQPYPELEHESLLGANLWGLGLIGVKQKKQTK